MQTHAERFRHLMQQWNLTQEELGHLCGLKRGTVGTIVNGKTTPDVEALVKLRQAKPELSWDWLLLGTGPMLRGDRALAPAPRPAHLAGDAQAKDLVAQAENVLLREQITDLRATVDFLKAELGKFGGSLEAALAGLLPTLPTGQRVAVPA